MAMRAKLNIIVVAELHNTETQAAYDSQLQICPHHLYQSHLRDAHPLE